MTRDAAGDRPASDYGFLVRAGQGRVYQAGDVFRLPFTTAEVSWTAVPLFTDPTAVAAWVSVLAERGEAWEGCSLPDGDQLADLLSRLKDAGVTHVFIDPPRGLPSPSDCTPIGVAILRFQMAG